MTATLKTLRIRALDLDAAGVPNCDEILAFAAHRRARHEDLRRAFQYFPQSKSGSSWIHEHPAMRSRALRRKVALWADYPVRVRLMARMAPKETCEYLPALFVDSSIFAEGVFFRRLKDLAPHLSDQTLQLFWTEGTTETKCAVVLARMASGRLSRLQARRVIARLLRQEFSVDSLGSAIHRWPSEMSQLLNPATLRSILEDDCAATVETDDASAWQLFTAALVASECGLKISLSELRRIAYARIQQTSPSTLVCSLWTHAERIQRFDPGLLNLMLEQALPTSTRALRKVSPGSPRFPERIRFNTLWRTYLEPDAQVARVIGPSATLEQLARGVTTLAKTDPSDVLLLAEWATRSRREGHPVSAIPLSPDTAADVCEKLDAGHRLRWFLILDAFDLAEP